MSEYKRVEDVLGKIAEREQIHGLVEPRVPSPAIYRREKHDKNGIERPKLKVGSRLVFPLFRLEPKHRYSPSAIAGYALGIVLDWRESDHRYWSNTTAVIQIVRVSNTDFADQVGRLRSLDIYSWGPQVKMPMFVPEEASAADYGL